MNERHETSSTVQAQIDALTPWYHRIDLGKGIVTPGDRAQDLVYALFEEHIPEDLTGLDVVDLGSNAGGLAIEFAKRGANVLAIENVRRSCDQAQLVIETLGLQDRITVEYTDVYSLASLHRQFDIVCYVGLSYHLRFPQLALDMLSAVCRGQLLTSTQTIEGTGLHMVNRLRDSDERPEVLFGWEPTEPLFARMVAHAGFQNVRLISTSPHAGEAPGKVCGNRSYFLADAATKPASLPFVGDPLFSGKSEAMHAPSIDADLDPALTINKLHTTLAQRDDRVAVLQSAVDARDLRIAELDAAVEDRDRAREDIGLAVMQRDERAAELHNAVAQRDARVNELQAAVAQRDSRIDELQAAVAQRDSRIGELDAAIIQRDGNIRALRDL